MTRSFKLPDLGEGIHEGEVLRVFVSQGDRVKEGDPLLEIETDKAAVEIPSPYTGIIREIRVKAGDTVNVGDILVVFSDAEGEEKAEATEKGEPGKEEPEEKQKPVKEKEKAPDRKEEEPIPASPATRRLARELGVDLRQVKPGGPKGLVTAQDVRSHAEEGEKKEKEAPEKAEKKPEKPFAVPSPALPDFSKWGPVERIPFRSVRRATARQMVLAWSHIPHVNSQDDIDVTRLEDFRRRHKDRIEEKGGKLTLTVFAIKAVATALRKYPSFNATLDTESGEIIIKHYFHLGVAADTEEGLIVPVIRDVDRKSITDLAIELNELVRRTRDRKIGLEDLQGGTFTITNIGPLGGGHFAPIINFPQVAILGMGSARMQPVVVDTPEKGHEIVPRLILPVVLCIDHRVLDGADAMRFMKVVKGALEDPDEMLMNMI